MVGKGRPSCSLFLIGHPALESPVRGGKKTPPRYQGDNMNEELLNLELGPNLERNVYSLSKAGFEPTPEVQK